MPSSLQPKVKAAQHAIMNAENKETADLAIDQLQVTYAAKYPKAIDK
ncbi:MAG: IS256 family transposase, partial [Chloroflexi bacterium]|nr:IS256 family transposase [Chloroflexota bacterium]